MPDRILGRHPTRVIVVVLGLVLVLNLAFFVGRSSDTSDPENNFPASVESVNPAPGSQADRRIAVTADLADNLTGVLVIDGQRIPEDQLDYNVPQGIITFRPGDDKDLEAFEAGEHTVQVLYWDQTESEPSNPSSYGWRFRATA